MKFQWLAVGLTGMMLSGCLAVTDGAYKFVEGADTYPNFKNPNSKCNSVGADVAKKANWQDAEVLEEEIRDEIYQSGLLYMVQNKPYVIRITNNDDTVRFFRAPGLLRGAAILKTVYNGKSADTPCMRGVAIGPGKTAEIHLVPLEAGGFDFHETAFWFPHVTEFTTNGSVGFAYVQ
ncbi:MAG: hypothetical protein HOB37_07810 [Rhodospirillaceae bacterium]|jgi:hypothetical protein|nr:hypothetical protein [Rhodospirillaceae bacterium]MBT3911131.1 hypothetical protein [Rhodospirillaceae bacterium]MBT5299075.1 hypothetical protein [Rhodospirillaceae bacterium]MBT5513991.1 hypothetical protein [Rhodospirillaceae bacterium]MBT6608353.1 hypothetical protein [Rhodospirillaceae bacterium]